MVKTPSPSVSVVICSYNHEDFLIESLESVTSQSVLPTQLIITDDASTDGSAALIKSWVENNWPTAELILSPTNCGLPATLNKVVPLLEGDYVSMMSADDVMASNKVERQLAAFEDGGHSVGMVYSDMTEIDEHGDQTGQKWFDLDRMGPVPGSGDLFDSMIRRASMAAPTVMIRRDLLRSAGPYDESLVAEDYDMFLRLSRQAAWRYIEAPLVDYRVLTTSLSRSVQFLQRQREGRIRLLRKHVGVSVAADLIIADRTAQMATSLYFEGRPGAPTAADLRFALGIRAKLRDVTLLVLSTLRVPGRSVARLISVTSSLRRRLFGRSHSPADAADGGAVPAAQKESCGSRSASGELR